MNPESFWNDCCMLSAVLRGYQRHQNVISCPLVAAEVLGKEAGLG